MAGKSTKSKGYRQYKGEKQRKAQQKENKVMMIGVIVFVVIILAVTIGIKVYDNYGTLKVKDHIVQNAEDSWIIKNMGTSNDPKVYKLAEMTAPVEGYTLEKPERSVRQSQVNYYNAEDESNPIQGYYVTVATGEYDVLVNETYSTVGMYGTVINQSEIIKEKIAGLDATYYHNTYTMDYSEAQDGSDIRYLESLNAYFDSKFNGYSILISVGEEVADEESFNSLEDLKKVLEAAAANMKICKRGE